MEPVVQTSRLRLAISSVQLFTQRCLLNIEENVHPSAIINSAQWQWKKRYRLWEANQKIFLFPENWLEPEFRDDKTHLFQELESTLLQGELSNELVEDAFFNYLKKLEELSRLDIVTMYLEEKPNLSMVHVIGRTFSVPHKYFYRRYTNHMWTPWDPVTVEIEGDHIVATVWKQRLHLFWVTFLEKAKKGDTANGVQTTSFQALGNKPIAETTSAFAQKQVEIRLNWCEYFQGQWTKRESSAFGDPLVVDIVNDSVYNSHKAFIDISEDDKHEDGLIINLSIPGAYYPLGKAFHIISKNSPPKPIEHDSSVFEFPYGQLESGWSWRASYQIQCFR